MTCKDYHKIISSLLYLAKIYIYDTTLLVFHKWSGNLQHKYFAHNTRANLFLLTELNFKIMLWPKINKEKLI